MTEIVIAAPVRTPIGTFNGSLKSISAAQLGAITIEETLRRSGVRNEDVGGVVLGNVIQAGNKMNVARQASIAAKLPVSVPAYTVNRVCGSGAQAIVSAAQEILTGQETLMVAGGTENMDRAPYLVPGGRWGYRMGHAQMLDSMLWDGLHDAFSEQHSGWHTEDLIARHTITRDAQDAFAARSQQRFAARQEKGAFELEIVPVNVQEKKGMVTFAKDEAPRGDTTLEVLSRLKPAFRKDGTITAGNSPGLNSGAAAMIVASRSRADALGVPASMRLVSWGIGAVEPGLFGLGPIPAVRRALDRAGWTIADIERAEINEAFAAVPIVVAEQLGLPSDIVNVDGGAIAHGHPIGATGAVLTTRLVHSMKRDGIRRGLVTLCIGGGQGIALLFEAI